ncbi:MAG: triple tyrosine motif-containing protein, partial [Candidatus Poribacteria bacterium]
CEDSDGFLWFATDGGATRYKRDTIPPIAKIVSVMTDKPYTDLDAIPSFPPGTHVAVKYSSIDFKTHPDKRLYRYRLMETGVDRMNERDDNWSKPTRETRVDYSKLKPGQYTFQVQAIDRDLNYSEPASVEITILPPPFYTSAGFIVGSIFAAFLIPTIIYALLLIQQRRQQVFEPIPNPYIVGNPIRGKEMFFGRQDDFNYIKTKLAGGTKGMVIVFCGERRSGKTSILFQICNGELGENFVPVLIDMQSMPVRDEGEFFDKIAAEISRGLDGSVNVANYDFQAEGKNPARTFEAFIDDVVQTMDGKSLLIMFDEYELLEAKIDAGILNRGLITFFASLLERHPNISFIFTGSRHLEQRNPEYWQILIGKSTARRITFLTEKDTLRLIKEPVRDVVSYQKTVPEEIYRLTAGQPFYTQVICQNLIDMLNAEERNRVLVSDLDKVVIDLSENPLPQMAYLWENLEPKEHIALALLGEVLDNPDRYATVDELMKLAASNNLELDMTDSEIEQVLTSLSAKEILDSERVSEGRSEYRYKADLFRHWVRREHSIWQVLA